MGRKRLRPWLEDQINRGTFPGLKYIDRHERIFSFPWKDQKKKSAGMPGDDEATKIVKAWARHSGMHTKGNHEDLPLWKSRIRISLTKLTDIKEVKELHDLSDKTNPYKAYKFVCPSEGRSSVSSSNSGSATRPQKEWCDWQMDVSWPVNAEEDNDKSHLNIPTVVYEESKFHSVENKQRDVDLSSLKMSHSDTTFDANCCSFDLPPLHHQQSDLPWDLAELNGPASSDISSLHHHQSNLFGLNRSSTAPDMSSLYHNQLSHLVSLSTDTSDISSLYHQQSDFNNLNTSSTASDHSSLHHDQSDLVNLKRSTDTSDTTSLYHQQPELLSQNKSADTSNTSSLHHQQPDLVSLNRSTDTSNTSSLCLQQPELLSLNRSTDTSNTSSLHHQQPNLISLNRSTDTSKTSSLYHQQPDLVSLNRNTDTPDISSLYQQPDLGSLNRSTDTPDISSLNHQQSDFNYLNMNSTASDMFSLYHQQSNLVGPNRSPTTSDMFSLCQHQPGILSDLANINGHSQITFDSKRTKSNVTDIPPSPNVDLPAALCSASKPVLKIKGYFMEKCILEDFIDERGARLFCGNILQHNNIQEMAGCKTLYGSMDLKQIQTPDFDGLNEFGLLDEKKQKRSKELQDGMERGLILRATESNISAERLCRSGVFVTTQDGKTQRLKRKTSSPSCVFDIRVFKDHLHYHLTEHGPQPSPSVKFFFGQDYQKNKKTFFYIKVTHIEAERLLMLAVNKSDNVDEICFSSKTPTDVLIDLLKGTALL